MNHFITVFKIIKECCKEDIPKNECYYKIRSYLKENKATLKVECYLKTLEKLEIIKFYKESNCIILQKREVNC